MVRVESMAVALACAGMIVGAGCSKETPPAKKPELILLCGSSFVRPAEELMQKLTAETGVTVATTSAGSEDFLPLIKTGERGDVLITHDPYLDYVRDAKALADHAHVGFVAPVLVVQPGNPKKLGKIEDLTRPGLKVALTDPKYSTCGEMIFKLLDKKGIKDAVMKNVGNRLTKGHSNIGTLMKTQTIEVGVMWNGVANTFKDSLEVVKTPYEYDSEIRVHVIGLSYSKHPELVKQAITFAKAEGRAIFAKHGYVK